MKTTTIRNTPTSTSLTLLVLAAATLLVAGCGKSDSGAVTSDDVKPAANPAADALGKSAETVKTEANKLAESPASQVRETAAAASAKAQGLIDQAKGLVADKKFQDASVALQQLAGTVLNAEQQKYVDTLKEQIKVGLAAANQGASAVGNLLKK